MLETRTTHFDYEPQKKLEAHLKHLQLLPYDVRSEKDWEEIYDIERQIKHQQDLWWAWMRGKWDAELREQRAALVANGAVPIMDVNSPLQQEFYSYMEMRPYPDLRKQDMAVYAVQSKGMGSYRTEHWFVPYNSHLSLTRHYYGRHCPFGTSYISENKRSYSGLQVYNLMQHEFQYQLEGQGHYYSLLSLLTHSASYVRVVARDATITYTVDAR